MTITSSVHTEITPEGKALQRDLERLCGEIIDQKEWRNFDDLQVKVEPNNSSVFSAGITFAERQIKISTVPTLREDVQRFLNDEEIKLDVDEAMDTIFYSVLNQEYGHHRHCPASANGMQEIVDGCYEAIKARTISQKGVEEKCILLHNMISDTILNAINGHCDDDREQYRRGLDLTYSIMDHYSRTHEKEYKKMRKRNQAFYLFLEGNLALSQGSADIRQKLARHRPFIFGFKRYARKLVDCFTDDKILSQAVLSNAAERESMDQIIERIGDPAQWREISRRYTDIIYPYLDGNDQRLGNSFSREGDEDSSEKKQGKKQREKDATPSSPGTPQEPLDEQGDKIRRMVGRIANKDNTKGTPRLSSSRTQPGTSFPVLDNYYRERAERIPILAEEQGYELPLERQEVEGRFDISRIDWSGTRIGQRDEDGRRAVTLVERTMPISLPFMGAETPMGAPDICWIIDSSCSVEFNPLAAEGKRGDYDYAALAVYGTLAGLEQQGVAYLLNYQVINFSTKTESSGWCSYPEKERFLRTALAYQGGSTSLDVNVLRTMRTTRRDNVMAFMLSDTFLNEEKNTQEVLTEIDAMKDEGGVGLYLFQLGNHSPFSRALIERGIPVLQISSMEDFMNLSIRITKDVYRRVV